MKKKDWLVIKAETIFFSCEILLEGKYQSEILVRKLGLWMDGFLVQRWKRLFFPMIKKNVHNYLRRSLNSFSSIEL